MMQKAEEKEEEKTPAAIVSQNSSVVARASVSLTQLGRG